MRKQAVHVSLLCGSEGQAGVKEENCMGHPGLLGGESGLLNSQRMHVSALNPLILAGSGHSGFSFEHSVSHILGSICWKCQQQNKSPRYCGMGITGAT